MPSQTANLATLAASGNSIACYMSVVKGNLVLTGAVSATPAVDGVVNLAYTVTTGSASNVKPGMRVDVYRSNGTDLKGRTRVRYAGTISTTNLPLRENAKGNIYIVSGDILRVYDDIRLSDKLVAASSGFEPDQLAYSDQGSNPPPLACSGGAWAGWDTMLPIPLTGSNSIWVDPDSNGPLTHLWTYPSGLTGSSTSAADPNITAATAGEYEVAHSVTDDDNTKSVIQYVPIVVHTAASPPYDILLETPDGDEQNGWSARVQVFDNAALSDIPDGSRVIIWKEEYLAGVRQSFGADSSGRSHILLDGYIRREEGEFDGEDGVETLTFEVISPMARLEELVGYSKVMDRQASPDAWSEIKTLKTKRAIIQIWQWYTNACEAGFDLVFSSSYRDKNYPLLFLQESTPLAQMRELADGTAARLTCLMGGRFLVHTKGERKAIADRAAVTRTLTITSGMYLRRRYTREHWSTLKYFELRGFIAATTVAGSTPVFSRWYGQSPGEGNQTVIEERRIVDSQPDANNEAGMGGAAAAGEYTIANGTKQRAVDLEYDFPSSYASVFDFYDEFVDVDDTTNLRELDFDANSATFVFVGGSFGYDNDTGTGIFTARFRQATAGLEGQTHVPLQEGNNDLPPFTPGDFDVPIVPWTPLPTWQNAQLYTGTRRIAHPATNGLPYTTNYGSNAATTWLYNTWATLGVSGTFCCWVPNGFAAGSGWIVTSTGVYYGALPTGTFTLKHTFATATTTRNADATFGGGGSGYFWVASYYGSAGGVKVLRTTDNTTFTETTVTAFYNTDASYDGLRPGIYASSHSVGTLWCIAYITSGTSATATTGVYKSTDSGATWARMTSPLTVNTGGVHSEVLFVPFASADTVFYTNFTLDDSPPNNVYLQRNGVTVSPQLTGVYYTPRSSRNGIAAYPLDDSIVLLVGQRQDPPLPYAVFRSIDDAASFTTLVASGTDYQNGAIGGDNPNLLYVCGANSATALSVDGGVNIVSQTGDLATHSTGSLQAIAGF